jgi:hypothetical protein
MSSSGGGTSELNLRPVASACARTVLVAAPLPGDKSKLKSSDARAYGTVAAKRLWTYSICAQIQRCRAAEGRAVPHRVRAHHRATRAVRSPNKLRWRTVW